MKNITTQNPVFSGNVVVGNGLGSGSTTTNTGIALRSIGYLEAARDGSNPARFNRLNSYGPMMEFAKDGNTAGRIGIGVADSSEFVSLGGGDDNDSLVVKSGGNVGIGTTDPASTFSVLGPASHSLIATFNAGTGGTARGLHISTATTGDASNDIVIYNCPVATGTHTFQTNSTERMRIDRRGNVGIGTTNPTIAKLDVWQAEASSDSCIKTVRPGTADRQHLAFYNGNGIVGDIKTNGTTTSYNTTSDYRLKTEVQPMAGATERLKALKPVNFEWIADGTRVDGFIAHEVQEIVPEAISGEKDAVDEDGNPDYQVIDQSKLVPLLTAAIQEQQQIIEDLKSRIETLEQ